DHPIGRGLLQPMLVPRAGALVAASDRWTPAVVLESTGTSWNETGPLAGAIEPDAEGERPGPLPLMLALERDRGGAVQRAVVAGDGDFLANAFLGNGANQDLGLRTVWWLLEGAGLVELPARLAPDLWLDLPRRRLALLGIAWLLLMPAALAAVGWRARRRLRRA
ncbi:MAG: ABC transporter, partial [Pseudomonadota bacterium]